MLARLTLHADVSLPVVAHGLCAGFPSPADDFLDEPIDLTRLLVRNPPATFLWKVDGHSIRDAGIYDRDLLVDDRSLTPRHRDVVVATVHGERSLKRLLLDGPRPRLAFENRTMPAFDLPDIAEVRYGGSPGAMCTGCASRRNADEPRPRPDRRQLVLLLLRTGVRSVAHQAAGNRPVEQ